MPFSTEAVVFDARTAKIVGLAVEVGLPHEDHRVHRGRGSHTRYQTKRCCRGFRRALGHVMSRPNRKTTGQIPENVILWLGVEIHETVSGTAAQDQHLRSRMSSRITPRASTMLPQSVNFARCDGTACFDIHLSIHTRMVAAVHSTLRGPLPQWLNQGRSSLKSRRIHLAPVDNTHDFLPTRAQKIRRMLASIRNASSDVPLGVQIDRPAGSKGSSHFR